MRNLQQTLHLFVSHIQKSVQITVYKPFINLFTESSEYLKNEINSRFEEKLEDESVT